MKKPVLFAVILATVAALGGAAAFSAESTPAPSAPRAGRAQRMGWEHAREKLGLTDEQFDRIKAELRTEKPALVDSLHKLHAARSELRGVIQRTGATETELRGAAAEVGAATADLAVLRARLFARIRPILTPEQIEKLGALQEKIDERIDRATGAVVDRLTE